MHDARVAQQLHLIVKLTYRTTPQNLLHETPYVLF